MPSKELADRSTEAMLLECASTMDRLVEEGLSPTDALMKVAQDYNLIPDQIRFLGRVYNTAVTRALQKSGSDLFEKASAVDLCDPELVVEKLYSVLEQPGAALPALIEKSAALAAEQEAEELYKDASHKVIMIIRKGESPSPIGSVHGDLPPCPMPAPSVPDHVFDLMRGQMGSLLEKIVGSLMGVGDTLAALKPEVRDHVVQTIQVIHGPGFKAIIRKSMSGSPFEKRPYLDEPPSELFDQLNEIVEALHRLAGAKKEVKELEESPRGKKKEKEESKKKAMAMLGSIVDENTDIFGQPSPERFYQNLLDRMSEEITENLAKHARASIIKLMQQAAEAREKAEPDHKEGEPLEKEAMNVLLSAPVNFDDLVEEKQVDLDPDVIQKIKKIQTESLLQFWRETDDVIRNFTDAEILAAVNELVQTYPDLPFRPAIFRALLRQYLQQGYINVSPPGYEDLPYRKKYQVDTRGRSKS